ncbi:hypothetical protein [Rhizobium mulingense]|uniref:hypothetical protein n=1 Tax=Rhizobium mulingense TaxID=3031128 RepID=UPI002B4898E0|nr:hypothetical protein [Rhizobium sp. MJ21]MEB3047690.1 hypothetical protein [Rhizobium sp. MJ21]
MRIEAVVTACDIIDLSFQNLLRCLEQVAERRLPDVTERERISTAMFCWAIVDQFYALSKLMARFEDKTSQWLRFQDFTTRISKMRNSMDHLNNNLGNAGKRKGSTHPLHGAILYACRSGNGDPELVTFNLGALHHDSHHSPVIDTQMHVAAEGVSNIVFAAFDSEVDISALHSDLLLFVVDFNASLEAGTITHIREQAALEGLDADELLNNRVSGTMKARIRLEIRAAGMP